MAQSSQRVAFVVEGEPISKQNPDRAGSKARWRRRVAEAARSAVGDGFTPLGGELTAVVVYFYQGHTDRDLDNIAKPILDGMNRLIYHDDGQIGHLILRKTEQSLMSGVGGLPRDVVTRLGRRGQESFVYIRIAEGPDHTVLP